MTAAEMARELTAAIEAPAHYWRQATEFFEFEADCRKAGDMEGEAKFRDRAMLCVFAAKAEEREHVYGGPTIDIRWRR